MADCDSKGSNYTVSMKYIPTGSEGSHVVELEFPGDFIRAQFFFDPEVVEKEGASKIGEFVDALHRGDEGHTLLVNEVTTAVVDGKGTFSLLEKEHGHPTNFIPHWKHIHATPPLLEALTQVQSNYS